MKNEEYIDRIISGAALIEHRIGVKPTVFMSQDIFCDMAERVLLWNSQEKATTVCGYDVKTVVGTNTLYVGFDLM